MRVNFIKFSFWVLFAACGIAIAQNEKLGNTYFEKGEFAKAYIYYEKEYTPNQNRSDLLEKMLECKQQLRDYKSAESLIKDYLKRLTNPTAEVWLGYNYQLQGNNKRAQQYYEKAIDDMTKNVSYVYNLGKAFEDKALFEYALKAYNKASSLSPNLGLEYVVGRVYGQLMQYDKMFNYYLEYLVKNPTHKGDVYILINPFIYEDSTNENNIELKRQLLRRSQNTPNVIWNETLAWLFLKEKKFKKVFVQYKAMFSRQRSDNALRNMKQLITTAREDGDIKTAITICDYLIDRAPGDLRIQTHIDKLDIELSQGRSLGEIETTYSELIDNYGFNSATVPLIKAYAEFLAYHKSNIKKADSLVQKALDMTSPRKKAELKVALADMLVYYGQYSRAALYYTQVQQDMKNDTIGYEALFKEARVSFFKGDFEWAESQLDALKSASSQLIANDAVQLKWLIKDNFVDSLQTPLKMYAKAELLSIRKKNKEAISVLDSLINKYPDNSIKDEALFKQANLLETEKKYDRAKINYETIVNGYPDDILADDTLFRLGMLNENHLDSVEDAKKWYEKIITDYSDSIFYVEARRRFRRLRGDNQNNL